MLYNAAAYARASKDESASSTIENQIDLIRGYVKVFPEICVVSVRSDNGFSGIDFYRPSFAEMMKDIEAGRINCVIVKDLSRLGRNYIEVGELIDIIFPRYNVRLIAVNDRFDSINPRSDVDEIIIPFKNLINEQYLRDSSIKIRSSLATKHKNGDFVAAFAPYGYKRGENDKHKLIIDEYAAAVVRDIFRWKISGMSGQRIADRLNKIGEPSPAEYKKRDTNYIAQFQIHTRALWSAVAVGRILSNPMYVGTLVQGKSTSPNYKVKKRIVKPVTEWHVVDDSHEPIIHKDDFDLVNELLLQDTRAAPRKDMVFPLSGMIFCGDCGNNMVRSKSGKYFYYLCGTSKLGKSCTSHCIRQAELDAVVLQVIKTQIACLLNTRVCLEYLSGLPYQRRDITRLNEQISDRKIEINACEKYKQSLYEDYKDGIISKNDSVEFGQSYAKRITQLRQAVDVLRQEAETLTNNEQLSHNEIENFVRYRNILELSRELTVNMIDRIEVFEKKHIVIKFRYADTIYSAV